MDTTTGRLAVPFMEGTDLRSDIDLGFETLAEYLRDVMTVYAQGSAGSRPTSTPESPGVPGRIYRATDTGAISYDHGTGWTQIYPVLTAGITDANVTDAKLASPNNGVWRTIETGNFNIRGSIAQGVYVLDDFGTFPDGGGGGVSGRMPPMVELDADEYAVAGKATKLRLAVFYAINSVAPGSSVITIGLHTVNAVGGAGGDLTIGVVDTRTGNGAQLPNSASGGYIVKSTEFDFPADGGYVIAAVVAAANVPASLHIGGKWKLHMRHV